MYNMHIHIYINIHTHAPFTCRYGLKLVIEVKEVHDRAEMIRQLAVLFTNDKNLNTLSLVPSTTTVSPSSPPLSSFAFVACFNPLFLYRLPACIPTGYLYCKGTYFSDMNMHVYA